MNMDCTADSDFLARCNESKECSSCNREDEPQCIGMHTNEGCVAERLLFTAMRDGSESTAILCTVSPLRKDIMATRVTLSFAVRARAVAAAQVCGRAHVSVRL
jgi:hypothetical protein